MAEFNAETAHRIMETCQTNRSGITESFNAAMSQKFNLVIGSLISGGPSFADRVEDAPGVMVVLDVAGQAIGCLIPESLPLPHWYRTPNESERSRLQTLGMEWSVGMLPAEMECTRFETLACSSLKRQLMACGIAEECWMAELQILNPMTSAEQCRIPMIWPLTTPRFQMVGDWPTATELEETEEEVTDDEEVEIHPRARRVLRIPVQLSVRIAQKKTDLRQIRSIRPGQLISFPKACEEPLDVYVGDQLFARGEAVKLGENFAIKIKETNSQRVREQRVFEL